MKQKIATPVITLFLMTKVVSSILPVVMFLAVSSVVFSGCSLAKDISPETPVTAPIASPLDSVELSTTPIPLPTTFTARFEVVTNGTKRIFTEGKYHNQSTDVYIEKPDPHLIYVKKPEVTWNDFFSTLPFSLTKECLVTGTNQPFCTTETKKLHFYLNGEEAPDALDAVISPDDFLRVEYGS